MFPRGEGQRISRPGTRGLSKLYVEQAAPVPDDRMGRASVIAGMHASPYPWSDHAGRS